MCTGGTYAFVAEYTAASGSKKGIDLKSFAKRLITSPPLVAYVVMFILAVANIDTPPVILTLIETMAKANTFVAMLMLGLLFHIEFKKEFQTDRNSSYFCSNLCCNLLFCFTV